jgi:hypothetical protein
MKFLFELGLPSISLFSGDRNRVRKRKKDKETKRQRDKETKRQTDKETKRQRDKEIEIV